MQTLLDEIHTLENTEPHEDRSMDFGAEWLEKIKNDPYDKVIPLLIKQIDVIQGENKTDFCITSTLKSALCEEMVAGEDSFFLTLPEFQPLLSIRRSLKRELH